MVVESLGLGWDPENIHLKTVLCIRRYKGNIIKTEGVLDENVRSTHGLCKYIYICMSSAIFKDKGCKKCLNFILFWLTVVITNFY